MTLSQREYMLGVTTLAILLFGSSVILARTKVAEWKQLRLDEAKLKREIASDKKLLETKDVWIKRYQELSKMLPHHPADKDVGTYWLATMDEIASEQEVLITSRQVKKEKEMGDVYELPIEVRWRTDLESLTLFLFDLQTKGAMLDVRQLSISAKDKGLLTGTFRMNCAYTREKTPAAEDKGSKK